jgi:hypothetical protein
MHERVELTETTINVNVNDTSSVTSYYNLSYNNLRRDPQQY